MSTYRRAKSPGGTFFFTVVTLNRQPILCDEPVRRALHEAVGAVRLARRFRIDAWVLLPDHLHCIWTLPEDDEDISTRWALIKRDVARQVGGLYFNRQLMSSSKQKHREATIWQRRFWEHCIRDEVDYRRHFEYLHFNPVKHGLVSRVADWPYSTFHRMVTDGVYDPAWAGPVVDEDIPEP